jgi:hypothetical protein
MPSFLPNNPKRQEKGRIMTPYVALQEDVINVLFRLAESRQDYLRQLVKRCRKRTPKRLWIEDLTELEKSGLHSSYLDKEKEWAQSMIVGIIIEQIDDTGPTIEIRNLLGTDLYNYGKPMDIATYAKMKGRGICRLRTNRLAQPGALVEGDILATGCRVLSEPREGGNGQVLLHLTGGFNGHWVGVPARIPIALLTPEDQAPENYVGT